MAQRGLIDNPLTRSTEIGLQGALDRRNQAANKVLAFEFGQRKAREERDTQAEAKTKARKLDYLTTVVTTAKDPVVRARAESELAQALGLNEDVFGTDELLGVLNTANALAKKNPKASEKFMTENVLRWGQDPSFKATREEIRAPIRREQREIFRGIPQEEGAVLTPQQERVRAGIAADITSAEITSAFKTPKTASDKFNEWTVARTQAGLDTSMEDIEGFFRKGGKSYLEKYGEWRKTFKQATGDEPSVESIRQFLIRDPFGVFVGGSAGPSTAEDYFKGAGVD